MSKKIIGVLHLAEFPKDNKENNLQAIKQRALDDLSALQSGGVGAVLIENEFEGHKSPYGEFLTLSQRKSMLEIVAFLRPYIVVPFGFCILLNDYKTAFLLAKKFGGEFIRLDTFVDSVERISDGIKIITFPKKIIEFRKKIGASSVQIWADVHVKHTKLLSKYSLVESARLAIRKGASKIIITGDWTGKPPKTTDLERIAKSLPRKSLVIGSGINRKNISKCKKYVDTFIIGSAFKKDGKVDTSKVRIVTGIF